MRIAYVALDTPSRVDSWSGIPFFALEELRRRFSDIHVLDTPRLDGLLRNLDSAARLGILPSRNPLVVRVFQSLLDRKLGEIQPDVVISVGAAHKVARISPKFPLIHVADALYPTIVGYYPKYSDLSARSYANGKRVQASLIKRVSSIALSSEWAAQSAAAEYPAVASRISVIPFGANLREPPAAGELRGNSGALKLLFVGYDWERKGGPAVLETFRLLREAEPRSELHIVGCNPPEAKDVPNVSVYGKLTKSDLGQMRKIDELFRTSNFLFMPSKYEAYGIVYCEACAFGLPPVAGSTGGISTIIEDKVNGILLDAESSPGQYVSAILSYWRNEEDYCRLQLGARKSYEDRLNWRAWGENIERIVHSLVS